MALKKVVNKSIRPDSHLPFDKREIREIVKSIESGVPRREIIARYGMHSCTLSRWMNRYASDHYQRGKRVYSPIEKRTIVRAVTAGMTIEEACITFGIKTKTTLINWIRQQQAENTELCQKIVQVVSEPNKEPEESTVDIQTLQAELAQARLKIQALQTMIDIAQEKLKIDIRKKSGAKQSAR